MPQVSSTGQRSTYTPQMNPNLNLVHAPTSWNINGVWTGVSVVGVLLLWQVKPLQPVLKLVIGLIILGLVLRFSPTVISQWKNLGK